METPLATATRLLSALEDLITQETVLIRTMDFIDAVQVRERAAPFVEKLCELAPLPAVETLRPRIDGLLERSSQNYHFLEGQLTKLQHELNRVGEARGRLRSVAPAYKLGRTVTAESRLNTAA